MASTPTIIYVTREIERALGMPLNESYRIVTNRTPYGETIKERYPDFVTLIEGENGKLLGTADLLSHSETAKLFERLKSRFPSIPYTLNPEPSFLVFKNTARIEPIAHAHGWKLLNPPAALSEKIENKLAQIDWLGSLASYLPPHRIETAKHIQWRGAPFVIQWAHGHTGGGTALIDSEPALKAIQTAFPERRARVSDYISGPSFTVNVAVDQRTIAPGNISYQITGLAPFTDSRFATVGNDWGAAQAMLNDADARMVQEMIDTIGGKMQAEGWRGLFGIDLIKDGKSGRIFLIEINARQPASAPFESSLQESMRATGAIGHAYRQAGMTISEAHIAALTGEPLKPIIHITDGAQIVQRVTSTVKSVSKEALDSLASAGFEIVSYANAEMNADLLRIQSPTAIMAGHDELNDKGKKIREIVSGQ